MTVFLVDHLWWCVAVALMTAIAGLLAVTACALADVLKGKD